MNFLDALAYPIRRSGWLVLLIGAIFSLILEFLQFAPFIGLAVALFSAGYFGAFYLDIISTTMTDRNEVPDWPSFSDFSDDILSPFFQLVGLVLVSFGPALIVAFLDHKASWFMPALLCAVAYGCVYFPMAVLASQALGGFGSMLPHIVLPAIGRALPRYLVAVITLAIAFVLFEVAKDFAADIPYAGSLLTTVIALYGLMFQGRLIGLIYRDQSENLGWD